MTADTTTTSDRVRLTGWSTFDDLKSSVRALTFGQLVERAVPIVEHYRSDLYHDAHWLDKNLNGPGTFYFACNDWGTAIGTDRTLVALHRPENVWRVEITCEDRQPGRDIPSGEWFATFTREKEADNG